LSNDLTIILGKQSTTTYTEYFQVIRTKINPEADLEDFPTHISELRLKGVKIKLEDIPQEGGELIKYHPFFRNRIFKEILLPLLQEKTRLQLCGPSSKQDNRDDFIEQPFSVDKYLQGKSPDLAFIPLDGVCTEFWLVVVGEIKLKGNGSFSDEEKGQIISYGARILQEQKTREFVFVFLTDCSYIQFFKLIQKNGTLDTIFQSPCYHLWSSIDKQFVKCSSGMEKLLNLFSYDQLKLGYSKLNHNIKDLQVQSLLGSGASGSVYSAMQNKDNTLSVLKVCFY